MQSHFAQLRGTGKGLIRARVPASRAIALLHPSAICECHCAKPEQTEEEAGAYDGYAEERRPAVDQAARLGYAFTG
jgi:hypothetical protein